MHTVITFPGSLWWAVLVFLCIFNNVFCNFKRRVATLSLNARWQGDYTASSGFQEASCASYSVVCPSVPSSVWRFVSVSFLSATLVVPGELFFLQQSSPENEQCCLLFRKSQILLKQSLASKYSTARTCWPQGELFLNLSHFPIFSLIILLSICI